MDEQTRKILGIPVTDPVEYWNKYWRHFTKALSKKDNFNTIIDSPRFVIENIISEIEYNDLKYRYIKMKGETSPERISELEDLFEINRDNDRLRQMSQDVEAYERAVKEKATIDEQARLRQLEAEKLNHEAEKIKQKE